MKRLAVLLLSAALLAAVLVPAAGAASRSLKGTWECSYPESGRLFGLITFVNGKTYKWNNKKRGAYWLAGTRILFRKGPMKGVFEHADLRRGEAGNVWINLYDGPEYGHSYTDAQCLKRRS
ncbi:MAG TPA: hypothetical protein VFT50_16825 [Baekduia sp.]|nr:hypothetical protein [Baekduia sp.]